MVVSTRTRNSIVTPLNRLHRQAVMLEYILLQLCFILLLCSYNVSSLNYQQETDGTFTAKSHKSFFNLETLVPKETANVNSRRKRSVVFTSEEVDELLALHQEFRQDVLPEAANMEYMTWDEDLATMAVQYSEKCIWGHGEVPNISPYSSYGQNLWIRGSTTQQPSPAPGVVAWHNEVQDYVFERNSCNTGKVCGHYTQIVWAQSRAVGCGMAFCAETTNWHLPNSWILTCHYGPAGNYVGSKPYVEGASCTKCDSHIGQCYDNMCRLCSDHNEPCECRQTCDNCGSVNQNNCTCACPNGWYGPTCENFCEDTHEYCWKSPGWPGPQYCPHHPSISRGCPKMCGVCVDPDPDFQCETPVTTLEGTTETMDFFTEIITNVLSGGISDWGEWGQWSVCVTPRDIPSCIGSTRTRTTLCVNGSHNVEESMCPGEPPTEVTICTEEECYSDAATSVTRLQLLHVFTMCLSYLVTRASSYT